MNRREFLSDASAFAGATLLGGRSVLGDPAPAAWREASAMAVTGSVPAGQLGFTLPHEHVMVDFAGAEQVSPERYERDAVVNAALPHLRRIRELGCRSFVDCTPAYLGRDPIALRRLSRESGVRIITNTGYYGARDDRHLPPHAFEETSGQLADRWIGEWRNGIDGTGVRPGFIKIGVDRGSLAPIDAKLVRAAARAHRETGLTIAAHTGPADPALEQIEILKDEGISPSAWIWVHAQVEEDPAKHAKVARLGGWVEFDGVGPDTIERHVGLLQNMKARNLLDRALISQDSGWYAVGEPGGGDFHGYATLQTTFLPALRKAGFTQREVHRLTVENPAKAFGIRQRLGS